jgi:hypothetical protein
MSTTQPSAITVSEKASPGADDFERVDISYYLVAFFFGLRLQGEEFSLDVYRNAFDTYEMRLEMELGGYFLLKQKSPARLACGL